MRGSIGQGFVATGAKSVGNGSSITVTFREKGFCPSYTCADFLVAGGHAIDLSIDDSVEPVWELRRISRGCPLLAQRHVDAAADYDQDAEPGNGIREITEAEIADDGGHEDFAVAERREQ